MENLATNIFEYNSGKLYYKIKRGKMLPGYEAGCKGERYWQLIFNGKSYRRHQVIFLLHHGYIPKIIDHIDGNCFNDSIENLRACTQLDNMHNRKVHKKNTSGYRGVSKSNGVFSAFISNNKKRIYLGSFDTAEKASIAYESAAKIYYGEFNRPAICAK